VPQSPIHRFDMETRNSWLWKQNRGSRRGRTMILGSVERIKIGGVPNFTGFPEILLNSSRPGIFYSWRVCMSLRYSRIQV
jgi:hypothetical protein